GLADREDDEARNEELKIGEIADIGATAALYHSKHRQEQEIGYDWPEHAVAEILGGAMQVFDEERPQAAPVHRAIAPRHRERRHAPGSGFQPIAAGEHPIDQRPQQEVYDCQDKKPGGQRAVGVSREAVAESVDHVEERIHMSDAVPEARQVADRIE